MALGTSKRRRAALERPRTPAVTTGPWHPAPYQAQLADNARDVIAAPGLPGDNLETPCA